MSENHLSGFQDGIAPLQDRCQMVKNRFASRPLRGTLWHFSLVSEGQLLKSVLVSRTARDKM
jgi:hypothetical protein